MPFAFRCTLTWMCISMHVHISTSYRFISFIWKYINRWFLIEQDENPCSRCFCFTIIWCELTCLTNGHRAKYDCSKDTEIQFHCLLISATTYNFNTIIVYYANYPINNWHIWHTGGAVRGSVAELPSPNPYLFRDPVLILNYHVNTK